MVGDLVLQYQILQRYLIGFAVKQDTFRELSVPACTPTLLVIVLQGFRQRVVDHESHIRFVDAHPKSNSCYNYLDIVPHPHLLDLPLLMIVDVRVVKRHFVIAIPQFLAYLLTLFPREAVDNASLSSELGLF